MFCTYCGSQLHAESDKFCASCGHQTPQGSQDRYYPRRRLIRPMYDKRIAGVCAGIAQYLELDVTLISVDSSADANQTKPQFDAGGEG